MLVARSKPLTAGVAAAPGARAPAPGARAGAPGAAAPGAAKPSQVLEAGLGPVQAMPAPTGPDAIRGPAVPVVPQSLRKALAATLQRLGFDITDPVRLARLLRLDEAVPDGAVGKLRAEVLADPTYAGAVRDRLVAMSDAALLAGADRPEARLLRLELLELVSTAPVRKALTTAIRTDLDAASARIAAQLRAAPATKIDRVVIGGGPTGSQIANGLAQRGYAGSTMVVDLGYGDGNFGTVRNFWLNSEAGIFDPGAPLKPGDHWASPLYGCPIQVGDIDPREYADAGAFGDSALIGLYAAQRRGVNVLTGTKVLDVEDHAGEGGPGRYRLSMLNGGKAVSIWTDEVVFATGFGKPVVPKGAEGLVRADQLMVESDPDMLSKARVLSSEDFLRATNGAKDPQAFWRESPGDIYVIGGGDASKTAVEHYAKLSPSYQTQTGDCGNRVIQWVGAEPEKWGDRYKEVGKLFTDGRAVRPALGRLEKLELSDKPNLLRLTFKQPDGSFEVREAGRVLLALGMRSEINKVLGKIAPDLDPKKGGVEPVMGQDPAYGDDSPLAVRLPGQSIFVAGNASGLAVKPGNSFLQWFGWKAVLFTDQVLAKGDPGPNPFALTAAPPVAPASKKRVIPGGLPA